jgi:uncharacterized membrane protein YozB (DUF420 family)
MTRGELGDTLALVNACLNGTSAVFLLAGRWAIARGYRTRHRNYMLAAFGTSALFLTTYLTRVALTGTHKDPHVGFVHGLYLAILGTHMVLAIAVVPLVLRALYLAYKQRFDAHRRVARVTFPVWLYVSVTGVLVYVILYRVPV